MHGSSMTLTYGKEMVEIAGLAETGPASPPKHPVSKCRHEDAK